MKTLKHMDMIPDNQILDLKDLQELWESYLKIATNNNLTSTQREELLKPYYAKIELISNNIKYLKGSGEIKDVHINYNVNKDYHQNQDKYFPLILVCVSLSIKIKNYSVYSDSFECRINIERYFDIDNHKSNEIGNYKNLNKNEKYAFIGRITRWTYDTDTYNPNIKIGELANYITLEDPASVPFKEKPKARSNCFIATAAFGEKSIEVQLLRDFRDTYLIHKRVGRYFVKAYYYCSPPIAFVINKSNILRRFIRFFIRLFIIPIANKK